MRSKNKKYDELGNLSNVYQLTNEKNIYHQNKSENISYFFEKIQNQGKIVLELCCAAGEYAIGLAEIEPQNVYVGVDIKGDRLYKGSQAAIAKGLKNVFFLRCDIRELPNIFPKDSVEEIWITFPDPQPNKETNRVISERFLNTYKYLSNGKLMIKTDDKDFADYAREQLSDHIYIDICDIDEIYNLTDNILAKKLSIKTWYENHRRKLGKKIQFIGANL